MMCNIIVLTIIFFSSKRWNVFPCGEIIKLTWSNSIAGEHFILQLAVRTLCRVTVRRRDPCMKNTEETIAKYDVDANLFRLGSTNPKKIPRLRMFFGGDGAPKIQKCLNIKIKNSTFFFQKCSNLHERCGMC